MEDYLKLKLSYIERFNFFLAALFSCIIIYVISFALIDEAISRFGAISFSIIILILSNPTAYKFKSNLNKFFGWLIDITLISIFIWSAIWFFRVKAELWTGFYMPTNENLLAGSAGLIVLLEVCRRAWGWSLVIMAIIFIVFGFLGPSLPGIFEHFGMDSDNFMQISWYSFDGVFGRITAIVSNNVLIFLIFGAILKSTGAGEILIKISTVLTSKLRGGAAHAAIVASGIFGMMSGSVAANIAGTGVFTIPMIKRQGFSANFAAAVETAASSGGQLTPPIMAAAVFVMADLIGMPLLLVIVAASLPALFKYLGLFAQVHSEAIKLGMKVTRKEDIPTLTRGDWIKSLMVILPIASVMFAFLYGRSPAYAGLIGVITASLTGYLFSTEFRKDKFGIIKSISSGGKSSAEIMVAVGVIGIVLGIVNETGIAIRFASAVSSFGESYLFLALLIAMIGALILGMGLPTLPAYLIIAIMIAPAIVKAGVDPLAAHMFVLYFAVYSSIVPPIAYGCFVAAPIAGAHPLITSFIALRISIVGLLVPFVFVYSPSILIVVDSFSWIEFLTTLIRISAAIWMFSSSLGGADFFSDNYLIKERILRLTIGLFLMFHIPLIWVPALIISFLVIIYYQLKLKNS